MKIITIALSFLLLMSLVGCSSRSIKGTSYDIEKIDRDISDRNSELAFDIFKELNNEDKDNLFHIEDIYINLPSKEE